MVLQSRSTRAFSLREAGDTIVEVMVAIVIVGLALALAYQLSNSSLRTSTQSAQRTQALAYTSAQVERLKDAYAQDPGGFVSNFENPNIGQTDFCVSYNSILQSYIKIYFNSGQCNNFEGSIFDIDDNYNGTTSTFTIKATWSNINGHGTDQQLIYYRFPQ